MPRAWGVALPLLLPWLAGGLGSATSPRNDGMPAPAHQPGVCHYGAKLACCYGWRRNSKGVCEATCEHGCRFGECVGPNKCRCFPGYAGKTCSQDVNECGLQPRPCPHRCVNMPGSYKCFCLSGYMLMPDATCANSRTCAMRNCQYGCEDTAEGPRCLCPSPGLHLAPNGRACTDIDECASGKAICPYNRRCVNTFGSYYCKCHVGFELQYISGQYDCVVIPENSVKEVFRARGTIKDTIKKLLAHKNSMKKKEKIKNVIPESSGTPVPKVQPFNSEGSIYRDGKSSGEKQGNAERKEDTREEKALKNPAGWEPSLRGDVFSPTVKEAGEFDLAPVQRKALRSKLEHKGHF